MNNDLIHAQSILRQGIFTCVLCQGDQVHSSSRRGVAPLLDFLKRGLWTDYSAADKVVGKATAFLYVLMNVKAVYAPVMTKTAIQILKYYGIESFYDRSADVIFNRSLTGLCPMETAVMDIHDPHQALDAILCTYQQMMLRSG